VIDRKAVEQCIAELRADAQSAKERDRVSVAVMANSLASTAAMLEELMELADAAHAWNTTTCDANYCDHEAGTGCVARDADERFQAALAKVRP